MKYLEDNQEIINNILKEKERIKHQYKQKEEQVKKHYNVDFKIEFDHYNKIIQIIFLNLEYEGKLNHLTLTYDNKNKKIVCVDCEINNSNYIEEIDYSKMLSNLFEKYKLSLVVAELNRLNEQLINILGEMNIALKNAGYQANNKS